MKKLSATWVTQANLGLPLSPNFFTYANNKDNSSTRWIKRVTNSRAVAHKSWTERCSPSRSRVLAEAKGMSEISAWTDNSDVVEQICRKKELPVKDRKKNEHHHWTLHIRISVGTSLSWQFWFFWSNLVKKGISRRKRKKWAPQLNSTYSNYSANQILVSTDNLNFLDQISPKMRKCEDHHWILYIWNSLGTKFQLKLTILILWTKFAQIRYF